MSLGRFPTYEAEERRRTSRPPGVEPVPLSGTPAPALPPHVVAAVAEILERPMQTPHVRGVAPLRVALAAELARTTGKRADPDTGILVTNGAMQALGVCFRSLLAAGDEVIVPTPCFFFAGPIRAAGGVPVYVPGSAADRWRWDFVSIERAIGERTRVLLLCNPGNPTGVVPTREDVADAVALADRHRLLVVTDEAYEASLWENADLTSAFGLGENVVVIRSLGKSLSLPQLRIGFLAGPSEHVEACTRTLEWDCLRVGVAAQAAALAALDGPRDWLDQIRAGLASDREVALAAIRATPGLDAAAPLAAPFLFVGSTSGASVTDGLDAVGLPVVDGAAFQAPGYARLPFGGATAARVALNEALERWSRLPTSELQAG
ncbi:MAG: pyridoxal phosphate-dependent aminotransferase [Thermoleophilia bacterium]|nr:pyridoxal phosphate-dependent aminotransferase [Thermoleophilia bacterium]